jgi:quercetin dioxygenase-like cupin family protein
MKQSDNVREVLKTDGVDIIDLETFVNKSCVSVDEVLAKFGDKNTWATRVVYNERFGAVLIRQFPGEGNRLHYHPDADECWVILGGTWEWYIEGEGTKKVQKDDIVLVKKNTKHKITCIGESPGIRLAITKPDVDHVYED